MFITMPIKRFKLEGNKVTINESVVEYEDISDDSREILESLISKGAYGSALLTLNKFYNVKSINESDYTQEEYLQYLGECNKMMEECVVETEARNFRPLINLNGLEIMESSDHIARGKGNKLLIEDFRMSEAVEQDYNSYYNFGHEDDEDTLFCSQCGNPVSSDNCYVEDETDPYSDVYCWRCYEDMCNQGLIMTESNDGYTGNSRADEIVFEFSQTERDTETFTKALNEISRMEFDSQIDKDKYDECIKKIQDLFVHKDKSVDDLKEEAEGTQCSDIAEKKDQDVGRLQKPKKVKHIVEALSVPRNHGFKGFRLNEKGMYTRGNYVLINEDGSIRAVNKSLLEYVQVNKLKYKDEYGNTVLAYDYAEKLMFQVVQTLNEKFKEYDYDFDFRIEEEAIKLFDKNENFDYEDKNFDKVESITRKVIGSTDIYLEPENKVIMTIADCRVK